MKVYDKLEMLRDGGVKVTGPCGGTMGNGRTCREEELCGSCEMERGREARARRAREYQAWLRSVGGYAFPLSYPGDSMRENEGMTLRDWFAGQALSGLLACAATDNNTVREQVELAYLHADAMLDQRKQRGGR